MKVLSFVSMAFVACWVGMSDSEWRGWLQKSYLKNTAVLTIQYANFSLRDVTQYLLSSAGCHTPIYLFNGLY